MTLPSIEGYTISNRLGTGGFASVYLAANADGELVAIKVLHAHSTNENDLRRFERERMTMEAFGGHPHIVGVHDTGETESGEHYMVLEYVDGGSVRDLIKDQGALHWGDALRISVQMCSALDVAHRSGVLHRDVKPGNVLLHDETAKLTDFGIARLIGQSQVTAAQSIIGTLAYTPPEVFHNRGFDGRGDIYQLGITMYEMLLGRAPFTSAAADNKAMIIRRILDKPAPSLAPFDIPQQISDLLDEVLAKDPADRPQSAQGLGQRLNDIERELGRAPTPMYQQDSDTSTAGATTTDHRNDIDTNHGLTVPIDMADVPTPPSVSPSNDANLTVAEPRPSQATSVLQQPERPDTTPVEAAPSEPQTSRAAASNPPDPETSGRSRAPWLVLLLGLVVIGGAGALFALNSSGSGSDDGANDPVEEPGTGDSTDVGGETSTPTPEFAPVDSDVFALPDGTDGVVFDSVRNSFGLTIVGSAGDGERVSDQRSILWTLDDDNGFAVQRDFSDSGPHRMWSIGVIDGETFLSVGDSPGLDGIAWAGGQASAFTNVTPAELTGPGRDQLRVAVEDTSQDPTFLVGGSRADEVTGLWEVRGEPSWQDPTWTQIDLGDEPGVISDIAVEGDLAVAVGMETIDGQDVGVMLIRRGGTWTNLIEPQPNTQFWGVAIDGGQIFAVGEQNTNSSPNPFAVISNADGVGNIHVLPIRSGDGGVQTGIARSVAALDDGTVIAIGDVGRLIDPDDAESAIDRDGAVWEYLPDQDVWTTRASPDLLADGFTELWAIDEWNDTVYVFGRTETDDGRQPAGAWTLTLNERPDSQPE